MEEWISKFGGYLAALVAGSIWSYIVKLFRDLNASFGKIRSLEDRVKKLEKESEDG